MGQSGRGDPCDNHGLRRLTRATLAVTLACFMVVLSQEWLTYSHLRQQATLDGMVDIALDQRSIARSLSVVTESELSVWSGDVDEVAAAIDSTERKLSRSVKHLSRLSGSLPRDAVTLNTDELTISGRELVGRARSYLSWRSAGGADLSVASAHQEGLKLAEHAFLDSTGGVIREAMAASQHESHRFIAELGLLLFVSVTLIAALLRFLLRPAVGALRAAHASLTAYASNLAEAIEELEAQRVELEHTNAALNLAQERLGLSSSRFTQLFLGLPVGCLGFDAEGRIIEWNRAVERLLGIGAPSLLERPIRDLLAPRIGEPSWDDVLERVLEGRHSWNLETTVVSDDGRLLTVLVNILPVLSADGQVRAALASLMDVTEQRQLLEAVQESEAVARTALDSLDAHLALLDAEGWIVAVNRSWRDYAQANGYSQPDAFYGWNYLAVCDLAASTGDVEAARAAAAIRRVLEGDPEPQTFEYVCQSPRDERVFRAVFARFTGAGPLRVLVRHEDITAQRTHERQLAAAVDQARAYAAELADKARVLQSINMKLEDLASRDALTGLCNYYMFQKVLEKEFEIAVLRESHFAIILMDVDLFKQYNDTFGHPAGDEVLREVAHKLASCTREADLVARYGGEEFVAILPGTDLASAKVVAERMRYAVESHDWPLRGVTISCGVAELGPSVADRRVLLELADQALYRSKAKGRNMVTAYEDLARAKAA